MGGIRLIKGESQEEWADRVIKENKELNNQTMKSIDEIIDQYTPYSKAIPTWDREDITQMLKEYARQECIMFLNDIREYNGETNDAFKEEERTSEELYNIYLEYKEDKL